MLMLLLLLLLLLLLVLGVQCKQGEAVKEKCSFKNVTLFHRNKHFPVAPRPYQQCLRDSDDLISKRIRQSGRWIDCLAGVTLWRNYISPLGVGKKTETSGGAIYLDVGGNIGSCSLVMLSYGIPVIAYEPLPSNVFYFNESVKANEGFADLTSLSVLAIGEKNGFAVLHPYATNQGMSSLGVLEGAEHKHFTEGQEKITVRVETLDDLLWPAPGTGVRTPRIGLMKLDVEGYEEYALRGGKSLLSSGAVSIIQFEASLEAIRSTNSSLEAIIDFLFESGYSTHFFHPKTYHLKYALKFSSSSAVSKEKIVNMTTSRDWDFFAVHSKVWSVSTVDVK